MAAWPYNTGTWRNHVRPAILARDKVCRLRMPGCTEFATEVHHLVPPSEGGHPFAHENLQGVCKSCNVAERNERHAKAWRREQGLEPVGDVEVVRSW